MNFKTLLTLLIILGITSCSKSWESEIHYIPESAVGKIIWIKFDQPNGEEKQYKREKRFYRIPENGLLKTKFKVNTGWIENERINEFYLVDKNDNIIKRLKWKYGHSPEFFEDNKGEVGVALNNIVLSEFYYYSYVVDTIDLDLFIRKDYNGRILDMEGLHE